MKRAVSLSIGLILYAATAFAQPAKDTQPTPYDFKGATLGISLDELRAAQIHDERAAAGRLVCSGDPVATVDYPLRTDEAEATLGVIHCGYYQQGQWLGTEIGLNVGGGDYASYDYSFDLCRDPRDGVMRLYRIVLDARADAEGDITTALRDKFGPPTRALRSALVTRLGSVAPRRTTTWNNGVSSIRVQAPSDRIDHLDVAYNLTRMSVAIDEQLRKLRAAVPDRM